MKLRSILIALSLVLLSACGGLSSQQKEAANKAITSLRKVHAATEVGVNYMQYGQLLIDAKAEVNNAEGALAQGDLRSEIRSAMDAYSDAGQAWGLKIKGSYHIYEKAGPGSELISKYSLPTMDPGDSGSKLLGGQIEIETAIQSIWSTARDHLERAESLMKGIKPPLKNSNTGGLINTHLSKN